MEFGSLVLVFIGYRNSISVIAPVAGEVIYSILLRDFRKSNPKPLSGDNPYMIVAYP